MYLCLLKFTRGFQRQYSLLNNKKMLIAVVILQLFFSCCSVVELEAVDKQKALVGELKASTGELKASVLYPYGLEHGDIKTSKNFTIDPLTDYPNPNTKKIDLNSPISGNWRIFVNDRGVASFIKRENRINLRIPSVSSLTLAPYAAFFNNMHSQSAIYYRETKEPSILKQVNKDIQLFLQEEPPEIGSEEIKMTDAFLGTFYKIVNDDFDFKKNTFQLVIGYDGNTRAYGIFNYDRLDDTGAIVGYTMGRCNFNVLSSVVGSYLLTETSNVGINGRHVYNIGRSHDCTRKVNYPITAKDDDLLSTDSSGERVITLSKPIPLFQGQHTRVVLSVKARLTLHKHGSDVITDLESMKKDLLLFGTANYNQTVSKIFYKEITNSHDPLSKKASRDVSQFTRRRQFQATHLLVFNFTNMYIPGQDDKAQNFQVVLISNGHTTYLVLYYETHMLSAYLKAGYSSKDCEWNWFATKFEWQQNTFTNTGYAGQMIFKVSSDRCFNDVMEKHGVTHGDKKLNDGDEEIMGYRLSRPMSIFGENVTDIKIAINGVISFKDDVKEFTDIPSMLLKTIVAPLFNDFTTENGGVIYNRETFLPETLARLSNIVNDEIKKHSDKESSNGNQLSSDKNQSFVNVNQSLSFTHAFIVTYTNVEQYNVEGSRNTFQVAFASNGNLTYAIFTFYQLDSIQSAYSGVSDGSCFVNFPTQDLVAKKEIVYKLTDEECALYKERTKTRTTMAPKGEIKTTYSPSSKRNVGVIVGGSVTGAVVFVVLIAVIVVVLRRKKINEIARISIDPNMSGNACEVCP